MSKTLNYRQSRPVKLGRLTIGGGAPVVVQSMTNSRTSEVGETVEQIRRLTAVGCELIRVAVPDLKSARRLGEIKKQIEIPLAADIHFDPRLALEALSQGVDKIRINPGNIGGTEPLKRIVERCGETGAALRIGVNSGSLEPELVNKYAGPTAEALVESALTYAGFCKQLDFTGFVVSLKSSRVPVLVRANRLFASQSSAPLHLGLTEAGAYPGGAIKTAAGLSPLLLEGIGDTLRVSLTGDPLREVDVAYRILQACGRRRTRPEIISCPTCGRLNYDMEAVEREVRERLSDCRVPVKVAIMGCEVNGPGEAREADVGLAGGRDTGLLFRKGEVVRKVAGSEMVEALMTEIFDFTGWTNKDEAG